MVDSSSYEKRKDPHNELNNHGLQLGNDGFVEWKLDEKQHPRNWIITKKAYNVGLVCFFEFWMTAISSSGVCFLPSLSMKASLRTTLIDCYIQFRPQGLLHQQNSGLFCVHIAVRDAVCAF